MRFFKAIGLAAFVCLLLLSVPRLITGPEEEKKPETTSRPPILCVFEKGAEARTQTAESTENGRVSSTEKAFSAADRQLHLMPPRGMHDNNGHVVRGVYIFSAYQSVRLSERSG